MTHILDLEKELIKRYDLPSSFFSGTDNTDDAVSQNSTYHHPPYRSVATMAVDDAVSQNSTYHDPILLCETDNTDDAVSQNSTYHDPILLCETDNTDDAVSQH